MIKFCFSILTILCFISCLEAQNSKRTNIWYFGSFAGINFNTNPPTPLIDGKINVWEGCATFCDTFGNILIYTDGKSIWNKNHQVIPGATNLGGDDSATQSGIIVPKPGSDSLLYVFSVDEEGNSGGLRYAIVDISKNGGLGSLISSKNILLTQCTEKLTAVLHCNKKDFWIIAHEYGNNNFITWELTNSGLSSQNIITVGSIHSSTPLAAIGYLKSSPDGSKLALGVYADNFFEIFDFNNKTGNISNPIKITNSKIDKPYGLEFSPNGKRLYLAGTQNTPLIFQINLDLPNATAIKNSLTVIGNGSSSYFGAIQNGPNGRIYIAKDNSKYLGVINNPNELGNACGFNENGFFLGSNNIESGLGLPNLMPGYYSEELKLSISDTFDYCLGNVNLSASVNTKYDSIIYQWKLDNILLTNQNNADLLSNVSGVYECKVLIFLKCESSPTELTKSIEVKIKDTLSIKEIKHIDPSCGKDNGSIEISISGGTPPFQYSFNNGVSFQSQNFSANLNQAVYNIIIKDSNNCSISANIELHSGSLISIIDLQIINTKCNGDNGSITISAINGSGPLSYSLNGQPYQLSNVFDKLSAGSYIITVNDSLNCSISMNALIENSEGPDLKLVKLKPTTCNLNNGILEVLGIGTYQPFQYSLGNQPFQVTSLFDDLSPGNYTIKIQDSNGCYDSILVIVTKEPPVEIDTILIKHTKCGLENGAFTVKTKNGNTILYSLNGNTFKSFASFNDLPSGAYKIYVIDENMCLDSQSVNVDLSESPSINAIQIINTSCGLANGQINIKGIGGFGKLFYSLDGTNYSVINEFNDLASGTYNLYLKDENNCISEMTAKLESSLPIKLKDLISTSANCGEDNGSISMVLSNSSGSPKVVLNGNLIFNGLNINNLSPGNYKLQIEDGIGCTLDTFSIISQTNCPIYIPNSFSPNADGINDVFKLYPHESFKGIIKSFLVFDRWGERIFEKNNFDPFNDFWDGKFNGKKLNPSVFVYMIHLDHDNGDPEILTGDITLMK